MWPVSPRVHNEGERQETGTVGLPHDLGALVGEHCQCTHTSQLGKHHLTGTVDVTLDTKRRGPRRASEIEVRVLTPTPT
jgi:hypothetical protein